MFYIFKPTLFKGQQRNISQINLFFHFHYHQIMTKSCSRRRSRKKTQTKKKYPQKTPKSVHKHKDRSHRKIRKSNQHKRHHRSSYSSQSSSSSGSRRSYSSSSSSSSSESSSVSFSTRQRRKTPHFQYRVGEKVAHKYRVTKLLGTGTFGRVVQGRYQGRSYAIKIIKPVPKYTESAKTQRSTIKDLCSKDPKDEYHLVRYIESLYHYKHFCLVFEQLGPSLYDIIKKNNYVGYPPYYVQSFARQLFQSIGFMHKNGYTHTDLKPENILIYDTQFVEEQPSPGKKINIPKHSKIKLIDFGGATHSSESHSSIINTRQYRCPEVLLQCCNWNESSDLWSIGCILVELATGDLLFPIHNDVDHIYMIDRLIARFPKWMTQSCDSCYKRYFKTDGSINYQNADPDIKDWDVVMNSKSIQTQVKGYEGLADLVLSCLVIEPKRRITCEQALKHPYFSLNLKNQRESLPRTQQKSK